jgi:hypothetical protein
MNRWRQRLDALQSDLDGPAAAPSRPVQNVQNVRNPAPVRAFEHFEQFEHRPAPPAVASWEGSRSSDEIGEQPAIIVERHDDHPRAWAEGVALLDPAKSPADVPPAPWRQFVDDARGFIANSMCDTAAALGWGSLDLFGADTMRPFARIDQAGLIWLLGGNRIVAMTAMTAVIETAAGVRQTYQRQPSEFGRVLAWQLGTNSARQLPAIGM